MNRKLNKKGFTLVELLVVVAIIGILAAIVIVSTSGTTDRVRVASLQSTLSTVTLHANLCASDGGTVQAPTSATTGGGNVCSSTTSTAATYPALNGQGLESANYQYITTNNTTVSAGVGTTAVVTCTVGTGSCVIN